MEHVFISYAREDAAYVGRLATFLRDHGVDVWFDRHIDSGERFAKIIQDAIDSCEAFVLVMSPSADRSGAVKK